MSTNFTISKYKLLYAAKALRRSILNSRGKDFKQELHNRLDQFSFDSLSDLISHENIKQAVYLSKLNWGNVNWQKHDEDKLKVATNLIAACEYCEENRINLSITDFQLVHEFLPSW